MPAWLAALNSFSGPLFILLALVGISGMTGLMAALFGARGAALFGVGLIAVGALVSMYVIFMRLRAKKKAGAFQRELQGHGAATPQGLSGADQLARLDDLRRKFEEGVEKFRVAGKSMYSVPWYLVVGEPGSGKTEAIRRSSIGFPPGLQDELQGVGGTINMNWWFTHQAVLLDIAGRLMFGEVESTATGEWTEFLKLLRRFRPNCPVNGLLLVIPADSLLEDDPDKARKKAERMAQQLDSIQRALDVRFPVFVTITKSDLINGFREFCDTLEPAQQQQIIGWTNTLPIDSPFPAERVAEYIEGLRQKFVQRRLELLCREREKLGGTLDDIDQLFDLPASLALIYRNLQVYMETVFAASEWSPKPLFIRGIYFTTAMREGVALDMSIASALGIRPEDLPDGKTWSVDRAFFLRDMFLNKVFREWGLVTRATNVRRQQRARTALVLGATALALVVGTAMSLVSGIRYNGLVGKELKAWQQVAAAMDEAGGQPLDCPLSVVRPDNHGGYVYQGNARGLLNYAKDRSLVDLHEFLWERVRDYPLRAPAVLRLLRPLSADIQDLREESYQQFFDYTVVQPVVDVARRQLASEAAAPPDSVGRALVQLLEIEADSQGLSFPREQRFPEPFEISALLGLAGASEEEVVLQEVLGELHGEGPPPKWLATERSIASYDAINRGLDKLLDDCMANSGVGSLRALEMRLENLRTRLDSVVAGARDECLAGQTNLVLWLAEQAPRFCRWTELSSVAAEMEGKRLSLDRSVRALEEAIMAWQEEASQVTLLAASAVDVSFHANVNDAIRKFNGCIPPDLSLATNAYPAGTILQDVAARIELKRRPLESLLATNAVVALAGALTNRAAELSKQAVALRRTVGAAGFPQVRAVASALPWGETLKDQVSSPQLGPEINEAVHAASTDILKMLGGFPPSESRGRVMSCVSNSIRVIEMDMAKKERFERVRKAWTQVNFDTAMENRTRLLALSPQKLADTYLLRPAGPEPSYAEQVWNEFFYDVLGTLVTQSVKEVEQAVSALRAFNKFPLNRSSAENLSVDELRVPGTILSRLLGETAVPDPGSMAAGAAVEDERLAALMQEFQDSRLGDLRDWAQRSHRLLRSLPPAKNQTAVTLIMSVLGIEEHNRRLKEESDVRDGNWSWRYLRYVRVGDGADWRTDASAKVADLVAPDRKGFKIEFRDDSRTADGRMERRSLGAIEYPGPWGALRMLAGCRVLPATGGPEGAGPQWDVELTVKLKDLAPRKFWIRIEPPGNMPQPEEWPGSQY